MTTVAHESPGTGLKALVRNIRYDVLSGFLVFLIALPLCLAISLACGYPAIAGVFTAIIGGLICPFISNSELTIKGPAAGLIVIALGAVTEMKTLYGVGDHEAYRLALGIGVAAAVMQILFAVFRTGILGDFFPTSAVHGMLAAIGIIIIIKQIPICFGFSAAGEPLEVLGELPARFANTNPEIALIGAVSLLLLFGLPMIRNRYVRMIPAQMVVVLVAVPLGMYFGLGQTHTYSFGGEEYRIGPKFLVDVPANLFGAVTFPDFGGLKAWAGWKWAIMFALIGTLESMLSAKAIDMIDPWKRKTSLDRDNLAVGIGNLAAALIGGLPMISEIVRSKANIDNGARTRFANTYHGLFLLLCVALIPGVLHRIPLAALAAMLVYTGYRLASPREFVNVYRIGREQLIIFASTIVAVLATDLLVGIAIGIAVKFAIHVINGVPLRSLFKPYLEIDDRGEDTVNIKARQSAVFSNWIPFKRQIENVGLLQGRHVTIDLSETTLVDHSVMEKLHELQREFEQNLLKLEITGLEAHRAYSAHPMSARRKGLVSIRRITVVAETVLEQRLQRAFAELGASGYTAIQCAGAGRRRLREDPTSPEFCVRIEVLALPDIAERMLAWLHREIVPFHAVTACVETVEVLRADAFAPSTSDTADRQPLNGDSARTRRAAVAAGTSGNLE
jgi:MFS superfamily sulfate permease-like transporter